MRKAKNFSNRLMAMLLSAAMIFAPIFESVPVYAAESDAGMAGIGTLPGGVSHGTVGPTGTGDADDIQLFSAMSRAAASGFSNVGGWNESIYAEIAGVKDADVTAVSWSGAMDGNLTGDDLKYLVRDNGSGVRIDIPGLKAGTYTLTVTVSGNTLTESGIEVYAYDRSGYAHFKYTDGVGAYKDDGTLKENAIVLYVTDENKNDVELTYNGITVKGIGNILNSVGQDNGSGKTSNGGTPNTNQGIIRKLAEAGKPLVVRFIGTVSDTGLYQQGSYDVKTSSGLISGLTIYDSTGNGGTTGDNGHMARMKSGKDITLEGIGYDAVIDGWGFHYMAESSAPNLGKSFEVRNLMFINTPEDAIGMEGVQDSENTASDLSASVERCWIHHNEFYCPTIGNPAESDKKDGDGSVDFKRGQYFTCSYNYFAGCHKTNLVGAGKSILQFNLTYHHNYWYMCKARGPLARNANIHMYNNIVDLQTDYAQNARANSYIFSEYNLFYASKNPQDIDGGSEGNGTIKSYNDSIASVINMAAPATVVTDKSTYVSNNCQFQARKIKYDKFDTDAQLSYIPNNNYKLDTDFTELRKVITSQTGVQAQQPKRPEEVTASEYSVISNQETVDTVSSLPYTPSLGSKGSGKIRTYAFEVGGTFNLEVAYTGDPGVLVNAAGENLLTGDGSLIGLPAGTYMIQANNFQPGDYKAGTALTFKEVTVSTLKLEANDPNAHYHKWTVDASKTVEPTCTETGKKYYTCTAEKDGGTCTETKEEAVAKLGHSWSDWVIDKAATETETGSKSRTCTRTGCDARETETIPVGGGGSGTGTGGTPIGTGKITHSFPENGKSSAYFAITGNLATGTSASYEGETYNGNGLKMESDTKIEFTTTTKAKLVLVFDAGSSKKVAIDGTEIAAVDGIIEKVIEAGNHSVTKVNTSFKLYAIIVIPEGSGSEGGNKYTITIKKENGSADTTLTVEKGSAVTASLLPDPTREGYSFAGWVDSSNNAITLPYTPTADMTIKATWVSDEVKKYTITIDKADGSTATTLTVEEGGWIRAEQLPTPTREGYSFTGWVDGSNKAITLPYKPTADMTLKATWEKIPDEIVVDPNKRYNMKLSPKDIPAVTYTEDFEKNGFTITAGGDVDQSVGVDGNAKKIDNINYTERLKLGKGGTKEHRSIRFTTAAAATLYMACAVDTSNKTASLGVATLNESGDFVDITAGITVNGTALAETAAGAISIGNQDGNYVTVALPEANTYYIYVKSTDVGVNFYAVNVTYADGVEPTFCTVTFNAMGGVSVPGQKVLPGETCMQPVGTLKSEFTFAGWYTDYECTQAYDFAALVRRNTTLYAKWTPGEADGEYLVLDMKDLPARDYTEKFGKNGFSFTASSDNLSVDRSTVTVDDVTYTGRLKLNGSGTTTKRNVSFTIDGNATLTLVAASANATATDRGLIITNGKSGTDKKEFKIASVQAAAKYTQELTAGTWYVYSSNSGVNIYYISVKGAGAKEKYTIRIDTQNGTQATERIIDAGTALTAADLPDPTRDGYTFAGWEDEQGEPVTLPYTPTKSMTITAKWQKNAAQQYTITIDRQDGTTAVVKTINAGTALTAADLPAVLTRTGYTFQGWEDEDGNAITAPYTPTKTMTIKAKWQQNQNPNPGPGTGDGGDDPKPGPGTEDGGDDPKPGPGTGDGGDHIGLEVELANPGEKYVYSGSAIKPEIIVTNNGHLLTEGVDYTVKYSNNIKAAGNTAKITVSGKGNLTGSAFTNFTIEPKALDAEDVKTGAVVVVKGAKAEPILVYNGVKLGKKDYRVVESTADSKGKFMENGTIKLDGLNNFKGSRTINVEVVNSKQDLKKFKVAVNKVDYAYKDGKTHDANVTVTDSSSGATLTLETDYTIVYSATNRENAGTVKFIVVGLGKYSGTVAKSFVVKPRKAANLTAELKDRNKKYPFSSAGVTVGNDLVVKDPALDNVTLEQGKDYKVSYSNNKKIGGNAKYTVTFLGNYKGSKAVSGNFTITAAPLSNATQGLRIVAADKTYKKPNQYKSAPYVTINGVALKGSDYKAEYFLDEQLTEPMSSRNKVSVTESAAFATVYVKITGKGNYAPADDKTYATTSYKVCKVGAGQQDLSKARVTVMDTAGRKQTKAEYTGREVKPAIKVEIKEGKTWKLVESSQYKVDYVNNVNKGRATVVITATGNGYVSSKTATFNIVAKNLKNQAGLLDNLFKMITK